VEERVLVWALGRDGPLTRAILSEAGFEVTLCGSAEDVCREAGVGAGVVIVAAELLTDDVAIDLENALRDQPPWSDLPVVIVAGGGDAERIGRHPFWNLGNVRVLDRPVSVGALVSTVRTALRARRRQYQIRDLLQEREEADRRKDEFLAVLAHELRNPLAPIRNALYVFSLSDGSLPAALRRTREMMERQVGYMARLIDDLLEVSRISRGKVRLCVERLDLVRLLSTVCDDRRAAVEEAGLTFHVDIPVGSVWVRGDPTRLAQVFGNLLDNAVKYTDPGGVVTVQMSVCHNQGYAETTVRDTGIGIDPDQLSRLFEPFSQAERTLERSKGGLGLGLSLVKGLVDLHGGEVRATSDGPGTGAAFVVKLPLMSAP
jgi:signal transduction histidine kinase